MTYYNTILTKRQKDAAADEEALVAYFGLDAEDCDNWTELLHREAIRELTNPSLRANHDKALSEISFNELRIDENGIAYEFKSPSLYSDKFLYDLAKDVVKGGTYLIQKLDYILTWGDAVDCAQLTDTLGVLIDYLHISGDYTMGWLQGTGHTGEIVDIPTEQFFQSWRVKEVTAKKWVFICRFGIAVSGQRVVSSETALKSLKEVMKQVEARQEQLAVIPPFKEDTASAPDLTAFLAAKCSIELCDRAAKPIGLIPGHGATTFPDLRIHALAAALKESYSLSAGKGVIGLVRLALARRYGVENYNPKYDPQHGKGNELGSRNKQWDTFFKLAKRQLDTAVQQKSSR